MDTHEPQAVDQSASYVAQSQSPSRRSGIELLKIFSIFIIVISHVIQTLGTPNEYISYQDYLLDFSHSTTNSILIILMCCQYFGQIGNAIFLFCSIWFILDKKTSSKEKLLSLIIDVWIISILIFIPTIIVRSGDIDAKLIIKSFFPTIFCNNWYITGYLLLCLLYPFLNKIIADTDQKSLGRITIFLGSCYLVLCFIKSILFVSEIIIITAVYFVIAYIKKYRLIWIEKKKFNIIFLVIGLVGNLAAPLLTNFIGLKIPFFSEYVLHWASLCSPFNWMLALGAFGLFYRFQFCNRLINLIAGTTLYIYIIHENLLLRTYLRPYFWQLIYIHFGYGHVIGWVVAMSVSLFVVSLVLGLLYSATIRKLTKRVSAKLIVLFRKAEDKIFKPNESKQV